MNALRNNLSRVASAIALLVLPLVAMVASGVREADAAPVALLLGVALVVAAAYLVSGFRLVERDERVDARLVTAGC